MAIQAQTFFATSLTKFELKQAAELYYEENIEEYCEKDGSIYGAQNEAYKCLLVEKVVNDLCFSWLGDVDRSNGVKRSVYIGLHLVYFWGFRVRQGLLRAHHRFTWGLRVGVRAPGWLVGI